MIRNCPPFGQREPAGGFSGIATQRCYHATGEALASLLAVFEILNHLDDSRVSRVCKVAGVARCVVDALASLSSHLREPLEATSGARFTRRPPPRPA